MFDFFEPLKMDLVLGLLDFKAEQILGNDRSRNLAVYYTWKNCRQMKNKKAAVHVLPRSVSIFQMR